MKHVIALFVAFWFAVAGVDAQGLAGLWRNSVEESFAAVHPKAKVGIREFAESYARAYDYYTLAREIGEALEGREERPDLTFVLDKANGYLSLSHNESSFIREAEMCYWNLPDGSQRFCVKFLDVDEEEDPVFLIAFYGYDGEDGIFYYEDVEGRAEMMDNLDLWEGNENLFLPRKGKDIKWGRNNGGDPIGWYRYRGMEGFELERVERITGK